MRMSLFDIAQLVQTKEDFIQFLEVLVQDLRRDPDGWENHQLETYLEAVGAWTGDMGEFYANQGMVEPMEVSWQVFAQILMAATVYE
jgi:hypothetical protein